MKLCEKEIPENLRASWNALRHGLQSSDLKESEAAEIFSSVPPWISLFAGIMLALFAVAGAAVNFLPLAGAYWAGKKLPDAPNVITLWRILVGVPLFFLWFAASFAGLAVAGKPAWFLVFLLLTAIGCLAYQPARQFLLAGWNGIRFPELRRQYLEFRAPLFEELAKHES